MFIALKHWLTRDNTTAEEVFKLIEQVYVFGPGNVSPLSADWRGWECIALTRQDLELKSIKLYGRVPDFISPYCVYLKDVPAKHAFKFINELLAEING